MSATRKDLCKEHKTLQSRCVKFLILLLFFFFPAFLKKRNKTKPKQIKNTTLQKVTVALLKATPQKWSKKLIHRSKPKFSVAHATVLPLHNLVHNSSTLQGK